MKRKEEIAPGVRRGGGFKMRCGGAGAWELDQDNAAPKVGGSSLLGCYPRRFSNLPSVFRFERGGNLLSVATVGYAVASIAGARGPRLGWFSAWFDFEMLGW